MLALLLPDDAFLNIIYGLAKTRPLARAKDTDRIQDHFGLFGQYFRLSKIMKRTLLSNRSLLKLSGKDTFEFLQNLISNDLKTLSDMKVIYSALLTPQGKFLHDFFVISWKGDIYLDCLKERSSDLIRRLTMYKLRADCTITDVSEDLKISALFDGSNDDFPQLAGDASSSDAHVLYADPRIKELGYRVIETTDSNFTNALTDASEVPFEDYTAFRLSHGVPEGGTDIQPEKNFLLEANFEELNGVSFSKGCYIGQELTARTKYRAKIKKRLFAFKYEDAIEVGDPIRLDGKEIATVSSFQAPYGLAFTRLADWQNIASGNAELEPAGLVLEKPDYVILPEAAD